MFYGVGNWGGDWGFYFYCFDGGDGLVGVDLFVDVYFDCDDFGKWCGDVFGIVVVGFFGGWNGIGNVVVVY